MDICKLFFFINISNRNNRMNKIENLIWKSTGFIPEQVGNIMNEKDKQYYESYNNLINHYSKMLSFSDMDLTKDYNPPKELYVEVRALDNINNIKTYEGVVNVEKNHTYSFRKSDIEHFLRRGMFVINE